MGKDRSNRLSGALAARWSFVAHPRRGCLFILFFIAWCIAAVHAQQALTNNDIVELVKGGLPESVILNAIASQPSKFDITAQSLLTLKQGGVGERIIRKMLAVSAKEGGQAVPGASPGPEDTPISDSPGLPTSAATFPTDFSAVQVSLAGAASSVKTEGTIYVGSGRLRFEQQAAGGQVVTVVDPTSMTGLVSVPGKPPRTVREFAGVVGFASNSGLNKFFLPVNPEDPCARYKGIVSCQAVGAEVVNDRPTTKWEFTHSIGGQSWNSYAWIDATLHIAIRRQFEDHVTELRDIREGAQVGSLFQMPASSAAARRALPSPGKRTRPKATGTSRSPTY